MPQGAYNPAVTAKVPIAELLAAPLGADWTIEGLAEHLLGTIAARQPQAVGEAPALVLDADAITDRQSRRLLRPLLACLVTKSAAESGTPVNLFTGRLCFKRPGPVGPVWITGEFENRPGVVRVAFLRSDQGQSENAGMEGAPCSTSSDGCSGTNSGKLAHDE
jgi:hypothetical protein